MKRPQGFDQQPSVPTRNQNPAHGSEGRSRPSIRAGARGPARPVEQDAGSGPIDGGIKRRAESRPAEPNGPSEPSEPTKPRGPDRRREPSGSAIRDRDAVAQGAEAALRRAQRERKRYERGEMRRFTKRTRHRRLIILVSSGVVVAVLVAVILAAFSPLLALRTIEVDGAGSIGVQKVREALAGQLGRPLTLVSTADVEADLAKFVQIRSVSTETVPPGTLVVRIVEREPIGVIQDGSRFETVDAAHVSIASASSRPAGLPLIHVSPAKYSSRASVFGAVAEVLGSLPADVLSRVDTISATTPDDVTFTLGAAGPTVVWGTSADSNLKSADLTKLLALPTASSATEFDVSAPYSVVMR
jgi:cell division protein FtsQ